MFPFEQLLSFALRVNWPEIAPPACNPYLRHHKNEKDSSRENSITVLTNAPFSSGPDSMKEHFAYALRKGRTKFAQCLARCLLAMTIESNPLVVAIEEGASDLVLRFLGQEHGGFDAEVRAIVVAAKCCNIDILRMLAEHNKPALLTAGIEAIQAVIKETKLDIPNRLEVVYFILDNDSDVTITREKAILLGAAIIGDTGLLRVLLDHRIGLGFLSEALVTTASSGDRKPTEMLFQNGAERTDKLAIIRALNLDTPIPAANLVKSGFEVEGRYLEKSHTALHYAAKKGFEDVVWFLLERNVLVNVYNRNHKTPLTPPPHIRDTPTSETSENPAFLLFHQHHHLFQLS
ncbi:ankyrin repeat-containing protein [Colletotrichum graminicola]|nr:ankyrin repeat-containing protein [Colletotrichum graminicola]